MNPFSRTTLTSAGLLAALCCLAAPAFAATPAHPLGNFTVNYHTGLILHPGRIDATIVVDRAEIAALQERPAIDIDHDGALNDTETSRYAQSTCAELADRLHLRTAAGPARWQPKAPKLTWEPGEAGLKTSRLTCTYSAPAALQRGGDITARTTYDTNRIGWREITVKGIGLHIAGTDLPATSPTGELRRYPPDPLAAPLDQRTVDLHATPTADAASTPQGAAPVVAAASGLSGWFGSLVARRELTVPVGVLALLLALILGASHALLPGHGKTIMAAYLAGRRGTRRDAVTVGATVTLTHTAGVLVLGLALPAATHLAGETVLAWLGTASGLIVTAIGLWLLTAALRNHHPHGHHHHHHHHGHGHGHGHQHHEERDPHGHQHSEHQPAVPPARSSPVERTAAPVPTANILVLMESAPDTEHTHTHEPLPHSRARRRAGKAGLIGMGIAGGLVPSPSALIVLLGAVALGRTAFGVLLVLAYGLGMAGTLTLAGLLLLHVKQRLQASSKSETARRLQATAARIAPVGTAALVMLVGVGLTVRALVN